MKTSLARLLTMNEAVCRSHQSVPQTNVPAKVRNNQIDILFFLSATKAKKTVWNEKAFWQTLVWRRLSPFWVPAHYLLSVESPAVAMREDEPTKTKSWAVLLWHCNVCQQKTSVQANKQKHKGQQQWRWWSREIKVQRPHQVGFGSAPAGVGLPKTQASVSIHDTKLHKTSQTARY